MSSTNSPKSGGFAPSGTDGIPNLKPTLPIQQRKRTDHQLGEPPRIQIPVEIVTLDTHRTHIPRACGAGPLAAV
jgi:hypothetical protein